MNNSGLQEELNQQAREIINLDLFFLLKNPLHESYSMGELEQVTASNKLLSQRLLAAPWRSQLNATQLRQGIDALRNLRQSCAAASSWNARNDGNPANTRNQHLANVQSQAAAFMLWFATASTVCRETSTQADELWAKIQATEVAAAEASAAFSHRLALLQSGYEAQIAQYRDRFREAIESAELTSAQKVASGHSRRFAIAAESHQRVSSWWFGAGCLFLIATGIVSATVAFQRFNASGAGPVGDVDAVLQILAGRVVLIVVLFLASTTCFRNYRANKHLAVTNDHRARALDTFEHFVRLATDAETKDFVLRETTKCIFGRVPSGYLSKEGESITPIAEVIKGVK